jgi:hypothetical protein
MISSLAALSNTGLGAVGRAVREPSVQTVAALAAAPVAVAGLQSVGISSELNTEQLAVGLVEARFWLTLSLVAGFGAMGGVVAELLSLQGNIELPHRVNRHRGKRTRFAEAKHMVDLGIVSRLLLGATAALAVLSIYAPTSPTALVVTALIAGSAATGVFRIVQARLLVQPRNELKRQRNLSAVPRDEQQPAA